MTSVRLFVRLLARFEKGLCDQEEIMKISNRPLYLVTDALNYSESDFLKHVESACQGGVDLVQLREKKN